MKRSNAAKSENRVRPHFTRTIKVRLINYIILALAFAFIGNLHADTSSQKIKNSKSNNKSIPLHSAKYVYQKSSESVVKIESVIDNGKMQGSGVSIANGGELIDKTKIFTKSNIRLTNSWILTNAHVVNNSSSITVKHGKYSHAANIEFIDIDLDVAILKIDGLIVKKSDYSKESEFSIGDKVYAIGSPLGLENSLSEGIISGIRNKDGVKLYQTTAPISPGNSGGGLFDENGNLIGITTFKLKGGENINFAIDVNLFDKVYQVIWITDIMSEYGDFNFNPKNIYEKSRMSKFLALTSDNGESWEETFNRTVSDDKSILRDWQSRVMNKFNEYYSSNIVSDESSKDELMKIMDKLQPNWRQISSSNEFKNWSKTLPIDQQKMLADSWDPYFLNKKIQEFIDQKNARKEAPHENRLSCFVNKNDLILKVDFDSSTVNGRDAQINDSYIRFSPPGTDISINRATGSIRVDYVPPYSKQGIPLLPDYGQCRKAEENSF